MSVDPLVLTAEVDRATERLLATVAGLDGDAAVAAPSLLPGWTRGHVLAHISRNADGLTNLLTWARTGVMTPQYASPDQRERDIAVGAPRGLADHLADVRDSATRFADAAAGMPAEAWTTVLDIPGNPQPAARVVWRRLREVEVHHVDLAAGYGPDDWPAAFGHRLLHEVVAGFAERDDAPALVLRPECAESRRSTSADSAGHAAVKACDSAHSPEDSGHEFVIGSGGDAPRVAGTASALAAWLIGRSSGGGLRVSPEGPLPTPPAWI